MRKKLAALAITFALVLGIAPPATAHFISLNHGHGCTYSVITHSYASDGYGWYHTWYQLYVGGSPAHDHVWIRHYTRIWESPGWAYVLQHITEKDTCFRI